MGTTSSFFGGSGGGGDPTGKFQAAATVAEGDLVVLNDNGTVQPVTFSSVSANLSISDAQTNVGGNGARWSNGSQFFFYNATNNQYINSFSTNSTSAELKYSSFNSSTGAFTTGNIYTQANIYGNMMAQDYNTTENFYFAYRNSSGNMNVRPIVYNSGYGHYYYGSEYGVGGSAAVSSQCVYCGVNDDGTVIIAGRGDQSKIGVASFTSNGNNSASGTVNYNITSNQNTSGTQIANSKFHGAHCGGNVHAIVHNNTSGVTNNVSITPISATSSGVSFGTTADSGLTMSGDYVDVCYDPVGNVGIVLGGQGIKGFTVNKIALTVTFFNVSTSFSVATSGGVGFNRTANLFAVSPGTAASGNHRKIDLFTLNSSGTQGSITTVELDPSSTSGTGLAFEYTGLHNFQGLAQMGVTYNSNQDNNQYITSFSPAYNATNMSSYFGEAKEAISTNAAGSVAILNRTKDIPNSSFGEGQKLFANPSGTALATSGTYRVGHATDTDTVLVLGDPS